jgi:hypothetical protein
LDGHQTAHVDLAGDGGGNKGGAAFLQEADGGLGFSYQGVELGGFAVEDIALPISRP